MSAFSFLGAAIFLLFFSLQICKIESTNFSVSGRQFLVNDEPFFMKGISYYPIPIGTDPSVQYDQFGNASVDKAVWQRDIANFQAMGINTIRTYGLENDWDHTEFFDALQAAGIYVIMEFFFAGGLNLTDPTIVYNITGGFQAMVTKQQHPAILMWLVNNEINAPYNYEYNLDDFFKIFDNLAGIVRSIEGATTHRPLATTLADYNVSDVIRQYNDHAIDIWCVQLYRGRSFGNFFAEYETISTKPLFITELGIDAWDAIKGVEDVHTQSGYAQALWNEIYENSTIVSGGCTFEYSDEWWKDIEVNNKSCTDLSNSIQGTCGTYNPGFPDKRSNPEWFGMYTIAKNPTEGGPDVLTARPIVEAMALLWSSPSPLTTAVSTSALSSSALTTVSSSTTKSSSSSTTKSSTTATTGTTSGHHKPATASGANSYSNVWTQILIITFLFFALF